MMVGSLRGDPMLGGSTMALCRHRRSTRVGWCAAVGHAKGDTDRAGRMPGALAGAMAGREWEVVS